MRDTRLLEPDTSPPWPIPTMNGETAACLEARLLVSVRGGLVMT